jgi:outer membrane receptor protein involved in Fe transport
VNYVEISTNRFGGAPVHGINEAWYIQDAWDITPNLSLQLGLRNDKFTLDNLLGETVLNLKNNWGPRVGVTWDPVGEGKDKVSASFGRYYIPPASNLSYRGADLGYSTFFYAPGYVVGSGDKTANFTRAGNATPTGLGAQITTTTNPAVDAGFLVRCPNSVVAGTPERRRL